MSPEEAITLTRIAKAAFPAQKFDEYTIDVWAEALAEQDFGACRAAITRLVSVQTFASVAEIIEEANRRRREAHQRIAQRKTFAAIEHARENYDREAAHAGYLAASAALQAKLAERQPENAEAAS